MILHAYVDVYVLCVCIVGHGCGYTTVLFNGKVAELIGSNINFEYIFKF